MSLYGNFSIASRDNLKQYILMSMGAPLVTVEITDDQLDLAINNALEVYSKYVTQDQRWLLLNLNNYTEDVGYEMPSGVTSVVRVDGSAIGTGGGSADMIWTTGNWLVQSGVFDMLGKGAPYAWVNYEASMQYLDLARHMLGKGYDYEFNPNTRRLIIYPDPKKTTNTGYVIVLVYVMRPEEQYMGEDLVKRLALAESKIIVGTVRSKFGATPLLGGGTVDVGIKDEGKTERDAIIQELKTLQNRPFGFMVE
jgi:hypothetical protein